jgi:hypothetical protein
MGVPPANFWSVFGWLFGRGDRYTETIKHDTETQKEIPNARAFYGGLGVAGFLCTLTAVWYGIAVEAGDDVASILSIVGGLTFCLLGSVRAYRLADDEDEQIKALWVFAGGLFCGIIGQLMGVRIANGWFREHIVAVLLGEAGVGAASGFYLLWTWHWREQHKPYEMLPMQRVLMKALKPHLGDIALNVSREGQTVLTAKEVEARLEKTNAAMRRELIEAISQATQVKTRPISAEDSASVAVRIGNEAWRADVLAFLCISEWVNTMSRASLVDDRGGDNYFWMPSGNRLDKARYKAITDQLSGQKVIRKREGQAPIIAGDLTISEVMVIVGELTCPNKMRNHYRS